MGRERQALVNLRNHAASRLDQRRRIVRHHAKRVLAGNTCRTDADQCYVHADAAITQQARHSRYVHRDDIQHALGGEMPI